MYFLVVIIIGYLFGCIHGSQIIGNYKRVNIKKNGMKNAGATNTVVVLGWKYGLIVAFIDIIKAVFSLLLIIALLDKFNVLFELQMLLLYANALFVIVGHNYPLTMNFKGGKGTASFFGILLVIDWKIAFIGLAILLTFAVVSNYFVIGTLFLYLSFIMYTAFEFGIGPTMIALMFTILFMLKHTVNFKRIFQKEEVTLASIFRREAS